ncbi:acyl-CoA Delta-9 desaturase [Helicoverpa armigera]|uniref:acyl-CoA Delta-9 desaturase n=1 Tax=Helicoverpa armigera TaxID=29058 RepID=UPI003082C6CF
MGAVQEHPSTMSSDVKTEEVHKPNVPSDHKWEIVWGRAVFAVLVHLAGFYGAFLFFTAAKWQTCLFTIFLHVAMAISVTAGAHRLWAHRAYKAKLPLRILLLTFFTMAFQNTLIVWARDHRAHHKYVDTDADPHNSNRGFFFSHIGWLLVRRHPEVRAHKVDLSDLFADPLLKFQNNYYVWMLPFLVVLTPIYIPTLWGEKKMVALFVCLFLRYLLTIHVFFVVNSVAHMFGTRPYDKNIQPGESKLVSFFASGEGFHNYHHAFPWDYRTAELGGYLFNTSRLFIDLMAKIGWAYDLKSVPTDMIERRVKRTGDGSHPVWGWDDPDMSAEDRKLATIINENKES